jgi:hypothetical protein
MASADDIICVTCHNSVSARGNTKCAESVCAQQRSLAINIDHIQPLLVNYEWTRH